MVVTGKQCFVDPVLITSSEDIAGAPVEWRDGKTALMALNFWFAFIFIMLGTRSPVDARRIGWGSTENLTDLKSGQRVAGGRRFASPCVPWTG